MTPTLIVDIDGVVLDHVEGMYRWANSLGIKTSCEPAVMDCYTMRPMFGDKHLYEIGLLLRAYSVDEAFASIPEMAGFSTALKDVREQFPDMKLIAISAPGASDATVRLRRKNLEAFRFDEIHLLEMGASKAELLKAMPKHSIYFDDLAEHVASAELAGIKAVLFRQPHNTLDQVVHEANDWSHARDQIIEHFAQHRAQASV